MIEVRKHKDNLAPKVCKKIGCFNKIERGDYYVTTSHWTKEKKEYTWICASCGLSLIEPLLAQAGLMWSQLRETITNTKAKNDSLPREGEGVTKVDTIHSKQQVTGNLSSSSQDTSKQTKVNIRKLLDS